MIVTTVPSFITLRDLYWGARRDLQFPEAKKKKLSDQLKDLQQSQAYT